MRTLQRMVAVISVCGLAQAAEGQVADVSGTYTAPGARGGFWTLSLLQQWRGEVTGTLSGDGIEYEVTGTVERGGIVGAVAWDGDRLYFEARLDDPYLVVTLTEYDAGQQPDRTRAEELVFTRATTIRRDDGIPPRLRGTDPLRPGDPQGLGNPLNPYAGGERGGFAGSYTDGLTTLELRGGAGRYTGHLTVNGRNYPLSATERAGVLEGTFGNGLQHFPFSVRRSGTGVVLESEGRRHILQYQSTTGPPGVGTRPYPPAGGRPGYGQLSDGTAEAEAWVYELQGSVITYEAGRRAGYGPGGRVEIALCSDGRFFLADAMGGGFGRGGRPATTASGGWRVQAPYAGATLELWFDEGTVWHHSLSAEAGVTFLDTHPAQVLYDAARCR